ncbi:MAG: hypothetical protein KDD70_08440 [Bdellovibrionales bacterium]|nr:hypothetical protein [Bdellovibrionales bacterium]
MGVTLDRRSFVTLVISAFGAAAAHAVAAPAAAYGRVFPSSLLGPQQFSGIWSQITSFQEQVALVGKELCGTVSKTQLDRLVSDFEATNISSQDGARLGDWLLEREQQDFVCDRTINVRGWILSETEASLSVLIYQESLSDWQVPSRRGAQLMQKRAV